MNNIYTHLEKNIAKNRYTAYIHPPYELEKTLILCIKKTNLEKALKVLKNINSLERANLALTPLNSLKYSLVASCTIFTRAVIEAGVDSETAFMLSDYYINKIDQNNSTKDTQLLEYKMLEDFINLVKTHKTYLYSPVVNKMIRYIKQHIETKLTLEQIATHVNLHPNYLGQIFKKEVGMTVLNFINQEKIEAIKDYLTHTNCSMTEISDIFNFTNTSYFSHYFKKHTHLTPLEYCKYHRQDIN